MSKLSFRARALDCSKPMPVYRSEEIPDLPDFAAINRAVPQMPTGMEKEEETEHHLQRALSAQQVYGTAEALVIPVPDIDTLGSDYDRLYPSDYRVPKQYIHIQALGMDQEIPDYDMDSEDEVWLNEQTKKMELAPSQFEEMMDRLEKGSGQQVVTLQEAKLLLKEDDDLTMSVYDYWLNKKLRMQHALIPQVKSEKRDGTTTNNPYVAFRRRTEKMQTRKNRKNDEASYEKMLKLRRDLNKAVSILEMIKKREKCKKELLQLTIEILEKRYHMEDFCGQHLVYAESQKATRPSYYPTYDQFKVSAAKVSTDVDVASSNRKPKREYKKRKHKQASVQQGDVAMPYLPHAYNDVDVITDPYTSDEELQSPELSVSDHEDDNVPDGPYAFRRKKLCSYQAPLTGSLNDWPWCGENNNDYSARKYRYCRTSLARPHPRFIGFARKRIGRGGRVLLDRAFCENGDPWDTELERYLEGAPDACQARLASTSDNSRPLHFWPAEPEQVSCDAAGLQGHDICTGFDVSCAQEAAECRDSYISRDIYVIPSLCLQSQDLQSYLSPVPQLSQQLRAQTGESSSSINEQELMVKPQDAEQVVALEMNALGSTSLMLSSAAATNTRLAHSFSSQPSSRFAVDSLQASLALSAFLAAAPAEAPRSTTNCTNGPVAKVPYARKRAGPGVNSAATPTTDAAAVHSVNCCNNSAPVSILSTKQGTATFPAVLRVGVTPNESGDSLSMSLAQSDLDYGDALLRSGINSLDPVTSMEVS